MKAVKNSKQKGVLTITSVPQKCRLIRIEANH